MRFIVDAQLPPALVRWLVLRGHEAEHVAEQAMGSASDRVIWNYALGVAAAIVTKDEDFAQRRILSGRGPPVIWVRLGNIRTKVLVDRFERMLPQLVLALERGETLIELV